MTIVLVLASDVSFAVAMLDLGFKVTFLFVFVLNVILGISQLSSR